MLILGFVYSVSISWNINGISHNFIHNPYFRFPLFNRLFSILESITVGFSQIFYECIHMQHHKGNADRPDEHGETVDWISIYKHGEGDAVRRMCHLAGSTETHCCDKLLIGHTVRGHIVVAFVSANCSSRLRPHDSIDGSMVVASASKSTLHLHNCVSIAISIIVITVVAVRVIPVIRIRIEERETKRVDEDEPVTREAMMTPIATPLIECSRSAAGKRRSASCRHRAEVCAAATHTTTATARSGNDQ